MEKHSFLQYKEVKESINKIEEVLDESCEDPELLLMAYELLDEFEDVRKKLVEILIVK